MSVDRSTNKNYFNPRQSRLFCMRKYQKIRFQTLTNTRTCLSSWVKHFVANPISKYNKVSEGIFISFFEPQNLLSLSLSLSQLSLYDNFWRHINAVNIDVSTVHYSEISREKFDLRDSYVPTSTTEKRYWSGASWVASPNFWSINQITTRRARTTKFGNRSGDHSLLTEAEINREPTRRIFREFSRETRGDSEKAEFAHRPSPLIVQTLFMFYEFQSRSLKSRRKIYDYLVARFSSTARARNSNDSVYQ